MFILSLTPLVSQNGLLCISDYLFACQALGSLSDSLNSETLDSFCDVLLENMASNKAATLRTAAESALEQMVHEDSDVRVLVALVPLLAQRGRHRSCVVAEHAHIFSSRALQAALDKDEEAVHCLLSDSNFMKDLSNGLSGRSVTAKKEAKHCCVLLLDTFGKEDWKKAVAGPDLTARKVRDLMTIPSLSVMTPLSYMFFCFSVYRLKSYWK